MKTKMIPGNCFLTALLIILISPVAGQQGSGGGKVLALPIKELGTAYAMAQELAWLDDDYFIVGRWDGTMGIFKFDSSAGYPIMTHVINVTSGEGVQMITVLPHRMFASSNDAGSALIWKQTETNWRNVSITEVLKYDTAYGVANSGTAYFSGDGQSIDLVIGHANGWLTFWERAVTSGKFSLLKSVNIRGPKPVNPYGLYNVRGISMLKVAKNNSIVITGSEDGDLCIVSFPNGNILSRTAYNPKAKLGINNLAIQDSLLLVANCSVGPADNNLWYYVVHPDTWSIQSISALNLKVDSSLKQVFNFDVIWAKQGQNLYWLSTTQEGYVWVGKIDSQGTLEPVGKVSLNEALGTPLAVTPKGKLALAGQNIHEFILQ